MKMLRSLRGNLFEIGKMDKRDYTNYVELYKVMTEYLRAPDLLIYLRAGVDTLVKQIASRGRDFEQGIPREYLEQLNTHYENWTTKYKLGPLLTIESDSLDFVNRKDDLERIVKLIEKRLKM